MTPEGLEKIDHMRLHDWPKFAEFLTGFKLWDKQAEILRSVQKHKRTAVVACPDSSKSFTAALLVVVFLLSQSDSIVITTAPTLRQVQHVIWREVARMAEHSPWPLGGELQKKQLEFGDNWYALGLSTGSEEQFKGTHSPSGKVLVVLDEAPGIKPAIWSAIDTLMTQEGAKVLAIGNAGANIGEFAEAFGKNRSQWNTIRIRAHDTPNVKAGKVVMPWLISPAYIEDCEKRWGKSSPFYRAKIEAEFVEASPDSLFPLAILEATVCDEDEIISTEGSTGIGVDVARSAQGDESVIAVIKGQSVEIERHRGDRVTVTAGRTKQTLERHPGAGLVVDDDGIGGGVTDILVEQDIEVTAFHNGGKARDPEHFANRRAEAFWNLAKAIEKLEYRVKRNESWTDDLIAQLSLIKTIPDSRGIVRVQSKDELPVSPDLADGLAYAHEAKLSGASGFGGSAYGATVDTSEGGGLTERKNFERRVTALFPKPKGMGRG